MNKKIASELAIGVILLMAIVIGTIFLFQNSGQEESLNIGQKMNIKPIANPVEIIAGDDNQSKNLANKPADTVCVKKLYEGEASLRGAYVLDTIPGSTKKEWMFKVVKEDLEKFPSEVKMGSSQIINDLLFIADANPDMAAKLKKATLDKPETITIQGFYFDCEGVPVVSIESPKTALAKYIKK